MTQPQSICNLLVAACLSLTAQKPSKLCAVEQANTC